MDFLSILLDITLIGLLVVGIRYALKLSKQLTQMREGRAEMERFVLNFNNAIGRAESGLRGLKETARTSGDDLEKLIEKGQLLRDELNFLTESADQMANRLSNAASHVSRNNEQAAATAPKQQQTKPQAVSEKPQAVLKELKKNIVSSGATPSAAERELLRVLEKLG